MTCHPAATHVQRDHTPGRPAEAAGFVTRARADDRRVVLVALTEMGRSLEVRVSEAQQAVVCRTGLGGRDLADLRQELKELADRVAATGMARDDDPD